MKELQMLTESFKTKYESFITGCDSVELNGVWNKDAYGEMDVFYENELLSVILSLIISDGRISDEEIRYLNDNFGFSFTAEELVNVYRNCGDEIGSYFESNFRGGYEMLKGFNPRLADAYKELFGLICRIIAESDGVVGDAERRKIGELKL